MPGRDEILTGLTQVAARAELLAVFWHVALAALGLRLLSRPHSQRTVALALSAPLASVALCAAYFGNPFNAVVFGATATLSAVLAYRAPDAPLTAATGWLRLSGAALVAFGWVYPHFLPGPFYRFLYAAPLGTIPCPTLSAVIGIALLGNGLVGASWSNLLALVGTFYALFGALRLGVTIDIVLLAGALALFARGLQRSAAKPA